MRSNITELPDISLSGIYKAYGYQDNMTYALSGCCERRVSCVMRAFW